MDKFSYYIVFQTETGISSSVTQSDKRLSTTADIQAIYKMLAKTDPKYANDKVIISSITLLSEPHVPVPEITQITDPEYKFELLHTYFIEVGTQGAVRTMTYRFGDEPYFMDVSGARWELDEIIAAIKSSGNVRVFALGNIK